MLYILGGLPGSGKSALARKLSAHLDAVYLRIDTIEHAIERGGTRIAGPEGYLVGYALAVDNLLLGLHVVADSVNPWEETRAAWRMAAGSAGAPYVEVEVTCSDPREHRCRVESRQPDIIEGFALPDWEEVINRDYRPWKGQHVVLDTAGQTVEQSFATLLSLLELKPDS